MFAEVIPVPVSFPNLKCTALRLALVASTSAFSSAGDELAPLFTLCCCVRATEVYWSIAALLVGAIDTE